MSGTWDQDEAGAFIEELFAKHHGEIYAYLFRMMRDAELAADMTQDAFVKAYKNYDTLEKPENARAWLYQIAHRVALDEIRRRKIVRFLPWTGESSGAAPSAERVAMDVRLSGPLAAALAAKGYASLTSVQQAVLTPETTGRDLLVSAQTGSGKTVGFGLAMASDILDDGQLPLGGLPVALAIAPTRELALQVATFFRTTPMVEAGAQ